MGPSEAWALGAGPLLALAWTSAAMWRILRGPAFCGQRRKPAAERRGWIVRSPVLDAGGGWAGDSACGELVLWGGNPKSGRRFPARATFHVAWAYKAFQHPRFRLRASPEGWQLARQRPALASMTCSPGSLRSCPEPSPWSAVGALRRWGQVGCAFSGGPQLTLPPMPAFPGGLCPGGPGAGSEGQSLPGRNVASKPLLVVGFAGGRSKPGV